jgi:hypothetical protein
VSKNGISSSGSSPRVTTPPVSGGAPSSVPQQPPTRPASRAGRSPSSGSSSRGNALQSGQALWDRLAKKTASHEGESKYVDLREELNDPSSQPLRGVRGTLIEVIGQVKKFINANRITVSRRPAATPGCEVAKTYVVGKSPATVDDYHASLLNAIDSKQGLFQFVPRRKAWTVSGQPAGNNAAEGTPSVLGRLLHEFDQREEAGQQLTIGKYTITAVTRHGSSKTPANPKDKPNFFQRYQLDVQWIGDDRLECKASVPITQAGLRFTGKVLQKAELEMAQRIFDQHMAQVKENPEPGIYSPAGIGRSATLMVHHEISQRINDGLIRDAKDLDDQIEQVIDKGREDRSPHFIHSSAQFVVLRDTLHALFKHVSRTRDATNRGDGIQSSSINPDSGAVVTEAQEPVALATVTRPIPDTRPDRSTIVNELIGQLRQEVTKKLEAINNLNRHQYNYQSNKFKLEISIGEFLRLQQVLLDLKIPPPPTGTGMPDRFKEMDDVLKDVVAYQKTIEQVGDNDSPNLEKFGSNTREAMRDATRDAGNEIFKLAELKGKVMPFNNGGADAFVRENEGNNCLLVSILQHATGEYHDRLHHDMATILRVGLGGTTGDKTDGNQEEFNQGLIDDEGLLGRVVDTVNALYGRDLQLHMMRPGFADSAQKIATPGILIDNDFPPSGTEPIFVLNKGTHYEAVAPISVLTEPLAEQAGKSTAQIATEAKQTQIVDRGGCNDEDIEAMNRCLNDERNEATIQIMDLRNKIKADRKNSVQFSDAMREGFNGISVDLAQIENIHKKHNENLCNEKINFIADNFNDRLYISKEQNISPNRKSITVQKINVNNPDLTQNQPLKSFRHKMMG